MIGCRLDICIDFLALLKNDKAAGRFRNLLSSFEWNWLLDEAKARFPPQNRWKHELSCLLTSGAFDSNKNVLFLAQLLHGDRKYLERAASAVVSEWWHLMPFYVFVKNFTVTYNELGTLAHECRDLFKTVANCNDEEFDPFLSILTMKDISVLQNLMSNPWLSVHLTDTLLHTDTESTVSRKIHRVFFAHFCILTRSFSLWEIGANYLIHCGSEGRLRLESHIEAMHIEDEAMAEALMRICEEQELDDSKACIVNTMTYRFFSGILFAYLSGKCTQIIYYIRCSCGFCRIVWQAEKDKLATLSALDHMADYVAELGSHSLAFLFNYYRFHRSLSAGDVRSGVPVSLYSGCNFSSCSQKGSI
ncbi:unnamed protein product [Angiostrongylus costaricensis]|uniref:Nuclear pore complex protein Nup85 n=1 Tax=Angiostrongylus costaricensis TaxID=334426 RepID=A0A3P7JRN2_ANGCS|nr:unnamed protein product [Angiostrongylus costaricensis]